MSLLASAYILVHGHKFDVVLRAFTMPTFYLALLISFPITLLLVFLIHRVTIWLDESHDWRSNFMSRLLWQFVFAVITPSTIDLGLISIHSTIMGENFSESPFLLVDFPIIVSFILLLNMYYVIKYLLLTDNRREDSNTKQSPFVIDYGRHYATLNPENEIICFYRSGHLIKVVTFDQEFETRGYSINDIETLFSGRGFIRINRSAVVNMKFVKGYSTGSKRDTLNILFNANVPDNLDDEIFIVTDKHLDEFKNHLADNLGK